MILETKMLFTARELEMVVTTTGLRHPSSLEAKLSSPAERPVPLPARTTLFIMLPILAESIPQPHPRAMTAIHTHTALSHRSIIT